MTRLSLSLSLFTPHLHKQVWERISTLLADDHDFGPEYPPYDLRFSNAKGGSKMDEVPRNDSAFALPNRNASIMVDFTAPGYKSLDHNKLEAECHESMTPAASRGAGLTLESCLNKVRIILTPLHC